MVAPVVLITGALTGIGRATALVLPHKSATPCGLKGCVPGRSDCCANRNPLAVKGYGEVP
jgi:hypothetical protein